MPSPPGSGSAIAGTFDVGAGRKLYLECSGGEGPTIVMVLAGSDDVPPARDQLADQPMKSIGQVCAYDRANLGSSDPIPGPRTITDLANDLVTLVHVAKVPGPYVFVGGSFGGNLVGVLAADHPEDVAGIVFVDSDPATADLKLDPLRKNLPAKTYKECCAPGNLPAFDAADNVEHIDWKGGFAAELASVHHLPKVPTIVLTAAHPDCAPDWPCAAIAKDEARNQAEWIKGNPRGSQKLIDSGHVMPRDAPQAILDATKTVVMEVRAQ
ncbi:MAG: alpha/beta hydrolase [Mycobacteriales bacterium]